MSNTLITYRNGKEIPNLPGNNTFHSKELFLVYEATKGFTPLLIVAYEEEKPIAKLLAVFRRPQNRIPISFFKQCLIHGTGEYLTTDNTFEREDIFESLLQHLTNEALKSCSAIEFRNLDNALFGYKHFRKNNYFAVNWLRVRSSLHDIQRPEERFSPSRLRQIKKGLLNGATAGEAQTLDEIHAFSKMLHNVYSSRIRRYYPNKFFFKNMDSILMKGKQSKIFIVKSKDKIIGGSVCIYSGSDAYLWFSGGMRKTHVTQSPGILAVWMALKDAHENGYRHLEFMDVGLPFRKHGYRDFVLRFGGKQSSTRRWFRFKWNWLNNLMLKLYM